MGDLSKNFSTYEFRCNCGCGICNVSKLFLSQLQAARDIAGISFSINSGCRCPKYNASPAINSKANSDHVTTPLIPCCGADLRCYYSIDRYKIINAALKAGIERIGIAKSFIHLGTTEHGNVSMVCWVY